MSRILEEIYAKFKLSQPKFRIDEQHSIQSAICFICTDTLVKPEPGDDPLENLVIQRYSERFQKGTLSFELGRWVSDSIIGNVVHHIISRYIDVKAIKNVGKNAVLSWLDKLNSKSFFAIDTAAPDLIDGLLLLFRYDMQQDIKTSEHNTMFVYIVEKMHARYNNTI